MQEEIKKFMHIVKHWQISIETKSLSFVKNTILIYCRSWSLKVCHIFKVFFLISILHFFIYIVMTIHGYRRNSLSPYFFCTTQTWTWIFQGVGKSNELFIQLGSPITLYSTYITTTRNLYTPTTAPSNKAHNTAIPLHWPKQRLHFRLTKTVCD
jgi:hypothetical protein